MGLVNLTDSSVRSVMFLIIELVNAMSWPKGKVLGLLRAGGLVCAGR